MQELILNEVETLVARALEHGEECDLRDWPTTTVRGQALSRVLLGLPLRWTDAAGAERTSIQPHRNGLRLRHANVTGPLTLDDAVGAEGGPLPPLDLQECVLSGTISLCRARLHYLSLAGSRLLHLRGIGTTIAGPLDISRISSAEPETAPTGATGRGVCWAELRGATIEGSLIASGACLVAPARRPGTFKGGRRAEYALDLRAATIGNELTLSPGFEACGGVNIRSARIDKDVMALGATLSAVEGFALTAAGARIGGSALFNVSESKDEPVRFAAYGNISFVDVTVDGSVEFRGAALGFLDAPNARISGSALFGVWEGGDTSFRFESSDGVSLNAATIAGALDFAGAIVKKATAQNAHIGGAAFLRAFKEWPFEVTEEVSLMSIRVGGNLEMTGAAIGNLDAENADIGGTAFLRASDGVGANLSFQSRGKVDLLGAKVRGDLDLSGATLKGNLIADRMEIGGNLWLKPWNKLPFVTDANINLSGAKIRNSLIVSGIKVSGPGPVKIDLSHSSVEVLDDENGAAWGASVVLAMEGLQYSRLAVVSSQETSAAAGKQQSPRARRLRWLALQYPPPERPPNIDDFSPDVYNRLALALRKAGYYADSRAVIRERLRVERQISGLSFARPFLSIYALLFDSGMSPARAVGTFLGFIAIGWAAAYVADHGSTWAHIDAVLELETSTVRSLVVPSNESENVVVPAILIGAAKSSAVDELPCGNEIEPVLYALDAFVPALQIGQERRCAITAKPAGFPWRVARAIYAILGWIVTALTILTISGVARRNLEA
jgi:hypothetical protein